MRTQLLEKPPKQKRRQPAAGVLLSELEGRKLLSITWAGGSDYYWNTAGNWVGNSVPTSFDDAVLPSGSAAITVDSGSNSVNSLTVQGSYSLTLDNHLDAGGLIDVPGTLELLPGSNGTVGATYITANPTGGPGNILVKTGVTASSYTTLIGSATGGNGNLHVQDGGKLSTQVGLYLGNSTGYGGLIIDAGGEVSGFVDGVIGN